MCNVLKSFSFIEDSEEDKFSVAKMMISVIDRVEKIVGIGKNAGHQHFSFSHNVFKGFLYRVIKS